VQVEAQSHIERTLDSVDTDFSIALRRMAISAAEERAMVEDRKIEAGAGTEFSHIQVSAEWSRRPSAESPIICSRNTHDSKEGANRNDSRGHGVCGLAVKPPMKDIRFVKAVLKKAESFNHAGPSPPAVPSGENVDLQYVSGFRPFDPYRAGERVDTCSINGEEL
jgi:hypothetical protein